MLIVNIINPNMKPRKVMKQIKHQDKWRHIRSFRKLKIITRRTIMTGNPPRPIHSKKKKVNPLFIASVRSSKFIIASERRLI